LRGTNVKFTSEVGLIALKRINIGGGKYYMSNIPLQKSGQPSDIANRALFLASEKASWITGTARAN
jgi:3-oxoacyl-[acyl-carrier protein] reductase